MSATEQPGVWVVAGTSWGYEGPYQVVPYPSETDALRAANGEDFVRAWFVPFGEDLRDVMNERLETEPSQGDSL
ncbi:hypothetical protein [Nocardia otitidiscaviarum]|uniref:hypothetical protein n=1 Tax=Nocardia otitidiscaviarum TaxID=1823 RepID=UPI0004A6E3B5|nr:hypothetical protein [Nocardia otitidiscaviarum]